MPENLFVYLSLILPHRHFLSVPSTWNSLPAHIHPLCQPSNIN